MSDSSHFNALNELRNTALHIANFLDATAKRAEADSGMSAVELLNRLHDCASILRESEAKATGIYFDQRQGDRTERASHVEAAKRAILSGDYEEVDPLTADG